MKAGDRLGEFTILRAIAGSGISALRVGLTSLLLAAAVVPGAVVAASAAGPAKTVIGCSARAYPPATRFASHPRECVEYRGNIEAHYTEIWMQKLRWQGWGGPTANARGRWHYCGMGSCPSGPLRAKAYRPVFACGRYAYTRMRVHVVVRDYRDSTYWLHLRPC